MYNEKNNEYREDLMYEIGKIVEKQFENISDKYFELLNNGEEYMKEKINSRLRILDKLYNSFNSKFKYDTTPIIVLEHFKMLLTVYKLNVFDFLIEYISYKDRFNFDKYFKKTNDYECNYYRYFKIFFKAIEDYRYGNVMNYMKMMIIYFTNNFIYNEFIIDDLEKLKKCLDLIREGKIWNPTYTVDNIKRYISYNILDIYEHHNVFKIIDIYNHLKPSFWKEFMEEMESGVYISYDKLKIMEFSFMEDDIEDD